MEFEKMKKWMELAKQFQQGSFWDDVFDTDYTKQMMDQLTTSSAEAPSKPLFPPVDIFQSQQEWIIVMDLPGVRKEDVELSVADYNLNITGVLNGVYGNLKTVHRERFDGKFDRTITLPEPVGPETNITAKFAKGTIVIRIPRTYRSNEKIIID